MRGIMRTLLVLSAALVLSATPAQAQQQLSAATYTQRQADGALPPLPSLQPLAPQQRTHHRPKHAPNARQLQRRHERVLQQQQHGQVEILNGGGAHAPSTRRNATASGSTRLRRVSARDYYNNVVVQRRQPANEWAYHTYDVHTNTFQPVGGPHTSVPAASGKGDDNTHDVEFISHAAANPDWTARSTTQRPSVRRSLVTAAPPPLVPARRGYSTSGTAAGGSDVLPPHATEDPFETNNIGGAASTGGKSAPHEPKEMERRHICMQQRTVTTPVKTTEVYTRPIWKHIPTPCQPQTHMNQMCTRVQLVHEQAFRDVIRHKASQQVSYDCCNGWTRDTTQAEDGCMKPVCASRCQNGGTCSGPDTCECPSGFSGRYCEHDINECALEKPCDQVCLNTLGSYVCKCREGFVLQSDQQSCKKIDIHDDDAFEARDLENEIENNEDVSARLQKIERSLANERVHTNELQKTLQATYSVVDTLKSRLNTLEKQQSDINRLQTNLFATESRTNKLESMVNLLMKCRNGPNAYCP